jgi:catechol 2,3-dioxygenase
MNITPQATSKTSINPATRLGQVSLTVSSLENQVRFYQQVLGFNLHWRDNYSARLGAGGADLLHLYEQPNVKRYRRVTGLYHVAFLFPDRRQLARAIARLFELKIPNSPTDHILTKTTYLNDPEGNGIELYAESPEDGEWFMENDDYYARRADGSISNGREPLDLEALFSHFKADENLDAPLSPKNRIGHVHLHVHDIDQAVDFYHGILGFDVMGRSNGIGMAFVSAGGYHHHIGLNTWQGASAPPPPPDAVGLRYFSIKLPDQPEMEKILARLDQNEIPIELQGDGFFVRDPSQNGVMLIVADSNQLG